MLLAVRSIFKPVTQLKTGYPAGVFWLPRHAGFDESGRELFYNLDDDGEIIATSPAFSEQDRVYLDPTPDFDWGVTNTFQFNRFDFTIFLRGVQGSKIFANSYLNLASRGYLPGSNVVSDALHNGFLIR